MPATPEETGKLLISMLETVEAGLHTGKLNDWGTARQRTGRIRD
jgi:hypothetical protein